MTSQQTIGQITEGHVDHTEQLASLVSRYWDAKRRRYCTCLWELRGTRPDVEGASRRRLLAYVPLLESDMPSQSRPHHCCGPPSSRRRIEKCSGRADLKKLDIHGWAASMQEKMRREYGTCIKKENDSRKANTTQSERHASARYNRRKRKDKNSESTGCRGFSDLQEHMSDFPA